MYKSKQRQFLVLVLTTFFFLFSTARSFPAAATEIIGGWSPEPDFPFSLVRHQPIIYNNRVYVFGGSGINDIDHNEILRANISSNGSLSHWEILSEKLPAKIQAHSLVSNGNKVYILGGFGIPVPNRTSSEKVYLTIIDGVTGGITSLDELTSLPKGLDSGGAVFYNNRIYFMGGVSRNPSGYTYESAVYSATLNPDGKLNSWSVVGTLPSTRAAFALFLVNNRIIIMGGTVSDSSFATNDVISTTINSDGTLSPFINHSGLPRDLHGPIFTRNEGYFFLTGGANSNRYFYNNTIFSPIDQNGLPSNWSESGVTIPTGNCCVPGLYNNNNLYILGGHNGLTYFSHTGRLTLKSSATPTPTPTPTRTPTPTPTPTSTPTPTPTPTAVPTPSPYLNVPDIKQYTAPWGSQRYDTASRWSKNPTIQRWGCALTSATMALRYFNHNTWPNLLNNWLNTQPDGYLRNGLLNWLAVSRFSRVNPLKIDALKNLPVLEFSRKQNPKVSDINQKLKEGTPPILKVPGHFVVAKGMLTPDVLINDPASATNLTLAQVQNRYGQFDQINTFTPSNTDLSHILLVINNNFDLQVFDAGRNPVSGTFSEDDYLTSAPPSIPPENSPVLNTYLLPKPADGIYRIVIHGTPGETFRLDSYLYDDRGNPKINTFNDTLSAADTAFVLDYQNDKPTIFLPRFENILKILNEGCSSGSIKKNFCTYFYNRLTLINKLLLRGNNRLAREVHTETVKQMKYFELRYFTSKLIYNQLKQTLRNLL